MCVAYCLLPFVALFHVVYEYMMNSEKTNFVFIFFAEYVKLKKFDIIKLPLDDTFLALN